MKYLSFVESPLHRMVVVENCDVETYESYETTTKNSAKISYFRSYVAAFPLVYLLQHFPKEKQEAAGENACRRSSRTKQRQKQPSVQLY